MSLLKHPKSIIPLTEYHNYGIDRTGRLRHSNQNRGRPATGNLYTHTLSIRMDDEMMTRLKIKAKGKLAAKIREYIEWGLENEE